MPDIRAGGRKRWSDKHAFTVRTGGSRAVQAANNVCQTSVFTDTKRSASLPNTQGLQSKRTLDSSNFIGRESRHGSGTPARHLPYSEIRWVFPPRTRQAVVQTWRFRKRNSCGLRHTFSFRISAAVCGVRHSALAPLACSTAGRSRANPAQAGDAKLPVCE